MSKKPKQRSVKSLLALLGADPYEAPPASLEEARFRTELDGGQVKRGSLERCHATGKMSFSSEAQAKQAARARLRKGANTGRLRVYKCEHCSHWHLTSQFKK
jgi:hypothetical protein